MKNKQYIFYLSELNEGELELIDTLITNNIYDVTWLTSFQKYKKMNCFFMKSSGEQGSVFVSKREENRIEIVYLKE
ncbi:hypothetical protein [Aureivirga sp. CE67]|uniref:hypothetical protein n=1 Tax=Aureivirga sp. CE67 TaxID=1788983 RepID=UPI0018CB8B37|nr:hypothetical protein [Aureivirga sp. CE67]